MEKDVSVLKIKMKGITKELEKLTGLKLKEMPNVDVQIQSFPLYDRKKNLIIWGKKDPMGRPTSERYLVEELAHAILHQNQTEWLPRGLHEYFSKWCAVTLIPVSEEELKNSYTRLILKKEIRDIKKFKKLSSLLENIGIHINLFLTTFCSTFNKMLSETTGERLDNMDFKILNYFDELNNPIEFPVPSYCASVKNIAKDLGDDEEKNRKKLRKN